MWNVEMAILIWEGNGVCVCIFVKCGLAVQCQYLFIDESKFQNIMHQWTSTFGSGVAFSAKHTFDSF